MNADRGGSEFRATWRALRPRVGLVGETFFGKLLVAHPHLRGRVGGNLAAGKALVVAGIEAAARQAGDRVGLGEALKRAEASGAAPDLGVEHAPVLRATLLATLRYLSGPAWSAGAEAAWGPVVEAIVGVLTSGVGGGARENAGPAARSASRRRAA